MASTEKVTDKMGEYVTGLFKLFLQEFASEDEDESSSTSQVRGKDYVDQAALMLQNDLTTFYVDFQHVRQYDSSLADIITDEYYRVKSCFEDAVSQFMSEQQAETGEAAQGSKGKQYYVAFENFLPLNTIRDLKTDKIGKLMSISGTVTRTSQVRPELLYGDFKCLDCGEISKRVEQQFKYTEPLMCRNANCGNRTKWHLETEKSVFVDWQMLRLQENATEIPAGSMPRSMKIILRNEIVEKAKPGDKCTFTGTLIVVPDVMQLSRGGASSTMGKVKTGRREEKFQGLTGLKALGVRELTYKLCFLACSVENQHQAASAAATGQGEELDDFTVEEKRRILEMKKHDKLYSRLAKSLAPTIFEHEDIKKGILLMLFGGVHKQTKSKTNLRGDINICIVGDPSTSKSQFLKYVVDFMPRAIYTSGKASSAAGLTASVVHDPETGEFTVEAGALMLADNGICCIDEFDKMDPKDQTAIHEAMEQQTISISKAGIQATLNARTSILAAANPIFGRYDNTKTLKQNIDISAPIMSRFDLFFVVLDECDELVDYGLAKHIVEVHQNKAQAVRTDFSQKDLLTYIRFARTFKPEITPEAKRVLVDSYIKLRGNDLSGQNRQAYRITVRQLESMIRLSEARARLDLSDQVTPVHVKEAAMLLQKSIVRVKSKDVEIEADSDDEQDDDDDQDQDTGMKDGAGGGDGQDKEPDEDSEEKKEKQKKKVSISFDQYQRVANLLVTYLRQNERQTESPGMKQKELISWYLSQVFQEGSEAARGINTEKELNQQTLMVKLIIKRLIGTDHILLVLEEEEGKEEERVLGVHPNYDVEADSHQHLDMAPEEAERERKERALKKKKKDQQAKKKEEKKQEKPEGEEEAEEPSTEADSKKSKTAKTASTATAEEAKTEAEAPTPRLRKKKRATEGGGSPSGPSGPAAASTAVDSVAPEPSPSKRQKKEKKKEDKPGASGTPPRRISPRKK